MTNQDFFRKNAPKNSVARIIRHKRGSVGSISPHHSRVNFNKTSSSGFGKKKRGETIIPSMHGSMYDTPFILEKEPGNKFKVRDEVALTMNIASEIPFLRTGIDLNELNRTPNAKLNKTHTGNGSFFRNTQTSVFSTT